MQAVARQTQLKTYVVDEVVTSLLNITTMSLAAGYEVSFRGFGRFEPRVRPPVTLRNPQTGTPIPVPARTTVVFLPSARLKGRMNTDG